MGAQIDGIGSNIMTVHGARGSAAARHAIAPDHIEIGSFMALAAVTGGELIVKDTVPEDLRMIATGVRAPRPADRVARFRRDRAGRHRSS